MGKCFASTGIHLIAMAAILTRREKQTIKVLMELVLMACYHNSLRVRSYLLRAVIVPVSHLPWRKLYDEGDSSSFLHITGLMQEAFVACCKSHDPTRGQGCTTSKMKIQKQNLVSSGNKISFPRHSETKIRFRGNGNSFRCD